MEITEPWNSSVLKNVGFENKVNAALCMFKQSHTQAVQMTAKKIIHCLLQKIAFAWVKTGGILRMWRRKKNKGILGEYYSKCYLLQMKGKLKKNTKQNKQRSLVKSRLRNWRVSTQRESWRNRNRKNRKNR